MLSAGSLLRVAKGDFGVFASTVTTCNIFQRYGFRPIFGDSGAGVKLYKNRHFNDKGLKPGKILSRYA